MLGIYNDLLEEFTISLDIMLFKSNLYSRKTEVVLSKFPVRKANFQNKCIFQRFRCRGYEIILQGKPPKTHFCFLRSHLVSATLRMTCVLAWPIQFMSWKCKKCAAKSVDLPNIHYACPKSISLCKTLGNFVFHFQSFFFTNAIPPRISRVSAADCLGRLIT